MRLYDKLVADANKVLADGITTLMDQRGGSIDLSAGPEIRLDAYDMSLDMTVPAWFQPLRLHRDADGLPMLSYMNREDGMAFDDYLRDLTLSDLQTILQRICM